MIFEIVLFAVLFFVGFFIGRITLHTSGKLIVDQSDPEKDKWTFEITDSLEDIPKKKHINLKVERR